MVTKKITKIKKNNKSKVNKQTGGSNNSLSSTSNSDLDTYENLFIEDLEKIETNNSMLIFGLPSYILLLSLQRYSDAYDYLNDKYSPKTKKTKMPIKLKQFRLLNKIIHYINNISKVNKNEIDKFLIMCNNDTPFIVFYVYIVYIIKLFQNKDDKNPIIVNIPGLLEKDTIFSNTSPSLLFNKSMVYSKLLLDKTISTEHKSRSKTSKVSNSNNTNTKIDKHYPEFGNGFIEVSRNTPSNTSVNKYPKYTSFIGQLLSKRWY